ncbi:MAG: FAD binding domain-containing protein [Defluviitaleaceae bacterium]|nr:FAD binding domain-containing protein [Defluviitaleaceae bacterium]
MVNCVTAHSLEEALVLRKNHELIPYVGGTDLMIHADEKSKYLFLHKVPEMKQIVEDDDYIRFGASCTFTEIIEHSLSPKILKDACSQIGAPTIRNVGSIGGNIGNGSPKADSALICMVTDSKLRLANSAGERIIPIKDFYLGHKKLDLLPDELIVEILMPKNGLDNYYHKKVGARNALAISRVSFAGIMDIKENKVKNCATAYGAVSDVIIRVNSIDNMLIGKTIEEAKELKDAYLKAFDQAIVPIKGRVGIEYRKDVCMNLLRDFLEINGI